METKMADRYCLICGELIEGTKAVGDTKIRDAAGQVIAEPCYFEGRLGYCHTTCKYLPREISPGISVQKSTPIEEPAVLPVYEEELPEQPPERVLYVLKRLNSLIAKNQAELVRLRSVVPYSRADLASIARKQKKAAGNIQILGVLKKNPGKVTDTLLNDLID
jgi:hypothetical protein